VINIEISTNMNKEEIAMERSTNYEKSDILYDCMVMIVGTRPQPWEV